MFFNQQNKDYSSSKITGYIWEYYQHIESNSAQRSTIFSLFGEFSLSAFATIKPPNIGNQLGNKSADFVLTIAGIFKIFGKSRIREFDESMQISSLLLGRQQWILFRNDMLGAVLFECHFFSFRGQNNQQTRKRKHQMEKYASNIRNGNADGDHISSLDACTKN